MEDLTINETPVDSLVASKVQNHENNLIAELSYHGVAVWPGDVATIRAIGIDAFLQRRQIDLPEKKLVLIRLILNEMKS